jgi:hypothetical protein
VRELYYLGSCSSEDVIIVMGQYYSGSCCCEGVVTVRGYSSEESVGVRGL